MHCSLDLELPCIFVDFLFVTYMCQYIHTSVRIWCVHACLRAHEHVYIHFVNDTRQHPPCAAEHEATAATTALQVATKAQQAQPAFTELLPTRELALQIPSLPLHLSMHDQFAYLTASTHSPYHVPHC